MDRKIALPVGFAVMALLAVVGMLSLLSFTAAQPTEASNFDSGNPDLGKITTETFNPIVASAGISGSLTATLASTKASEVTSYTFTFVVAEDLANGTDEIIITWDEDFKNFPTTISPSSVSIRAIGDGGGCGVLFADLDSCGVTGSSGNEGQAVAPEEINVEFVTPLNADLQPQTRLRIPDMDTDDNSGGNGIRAGATVTIVFRQQAGISNPPENNVNYTLEVRVTENGEDGGYAGFGTEARTFFFIQARMQPSNDDGKRGGSFTVVATGIEGGESVTFFHDINGDGLRQGGERDLCSVVADRDDTATCTFTISNPPFDPGRGTDCVVANIGTSFDCNFINFVDSEGRSTTGELGKDLDDAAVDRQTFELDQSVGAAPSTTNVGDRIIISLFDWLPGDIIRITIGNVNVTPANFSETIPNSGEDSFDFIIPGVAPACIPFNGGASTGDCIGVGDDNPDAGIRIVTGKVPLKVRTATQNEDTNITIAGANLSLSHSTVVANQDLTISGNGFSESIGGEDFCILEGDIILNNVGLQFDDDDDCPVGNGILLTSGGTFTLTVRVHDVLGSSSTALNTALLQEGSHELKVTDTNGAEGTIQVEFAERTLEVTPTSARPRDTITIIGRNFIADNPDGLSSTVTVKYQCGNSSRTTTADPDVSGNWRETLRIPSGCSIPSTNTITADINADGESTNVVETTTHEIPEGLITIEPGRGASGSRVTVRGIGFRSFESVEILEFGGLGTLGGRTVNTDANGDFEILDVLIPGLDAGIHAVKVEVSTGGNRTSSSTSFEVLESGLIGQPTPIADVYVMSDNLLRIFRFDNSTKEWEFNDKRDEFAEANTLDELVTGGVYWILIDQDVTLDVDGVLINLTCTGGDCWNLVVWP